MLLQKTQTTLDIKIDEILPDIQAEQTSFQSANGKYKQYLKSDEILVNSKTYSALPFDVDVHEHKYPDDSCGYTVYFYYQDGADKYTKTILPDKTVINWTLIIKEEI